VKTYLHNWSIYLRGFRWLWRTDMILYKPGWTPARFLVPYCTTYLLGTLFGCGVVSLSRWWYDRREHHAFSRWMTRLLDWAFPGSKHGRHTGPRLWGSKDLWR
jgi:hypothetical protein